MLSMRRQSLGSILIIHCAGHIAFPDAGALQTAAVRELRGRTLLLDLAEIVTVDAAGLGTLLSLRRWAKETGRVLKLMNLPSKVEELLGMTGLKSVFEVCSAREMLDLLCRAIHEDEFSQFEALPDGKPSDQAVMA